MSYAAAMRNLTLHYLRKTGEIARSRLRPPLRVRPWQPLTSRDVPEQGCWCLLCGWSGAQFRGGLHSEFARCPRCGAVARDRFLYLCMVQRVAYRRDLRVLETSPRLGEGYRRVMARRVDYLTSDYDERAHKAQLMLDLTRMEMADESLDLVVTPHVLEHIPDTDAALRELYRVLRQGGRALIQVPLLQPYTAPPREPEFHGDDTPVFWRFGFDLTKRLREHGFTATLLVTQDFRRRVLQQDTNWPEGISGEFDAVGMIKAANPADLTVVASDQVAERSWLRPSYMHAAWECVKQAVSIGDRQSL